MTEQGYPVDNNTYNLLQMLASKLEAQEAYRKYLNDADQQTRGLIQELMQQDEQAARRLLQAVKQVVQNQ